MSSIGKASVRAVKWSAFATAARFSLQLVAQTILARILGPENYGIFGIGMIVYTFSNFLASFGFGWSLQQRQTISDEDVRFAFTWQVLVGMTTMLGLYLLAPTLAAYFHEPRSQPVIEWMSLACLLSAAASPAGNLLQRDLNFKSLGLMQIGSYAIGYIIVGIPMALAGYGAAALVAAWLTQVAIGSVGNYVMHPHAVRPLFWYPGAKATFGIGSTVFITNIFNWLLNNLDRVFIGRLLNTQAVGLYTAGYNLANMPNTLLLGALQPAFLSAGARLQDEPHRLKQAYLQIIATIWVLILPLFVFLAAISTDVVQFLYGAKWSQTAGVLAILFLGMPAYVTWGLSTPVLWNTGRKQYEFLLQIPVLALGAIGFYLMTDRGIYAAATVASLLFLSRALVIGTAAFRAVGLHFSDLLPHLLRGILLSILSALAAVTGHHVSVCLGMPLVSLMLSSLLALVFTAPLMFWQPLLLGEHAATMLIRFLPRLSNLLSKAIVNRTSRVPNQSGRK